MSNELLDHKDYISMIRQIPSEPVQEVSVGKSEGEIESMFKFMWYYLHPDSVLSKEKDFPFRKKEAMLKSGHLPTGVIDSINSEDEWFQYMVFFAFKSINDLAYEQWFTLRVDYMRTAAFLRKPPSNEKEVALQLKIRDAFNDQLKVLAEVEERFFDSTPHSAILKSLATINISAGLVEEFSITQSEYRGYEGLDD